MITVFMHPENGEVRADAKEDAASPIPLVVMHVEYEDTTISLFLRSSEDADKIVSAAREARDMLVMAEERQRRAALTPQEREAEDGETRVNEKLDDMFRK